MKIIFSPNDGVWVASGKGYDRPIVAEGLTLSEAMSAFYSVLGHQYAAAQAMTALSLWRKQ